MRLRHLPWLPLIQIAALTVFFAILLDFLVVLALTEIGFLRSLLLPWLNFAPPITQCLVGAGMGVLAVYLFERLHPGTWLTAASLWALVLCTALCLWLRTLLPLPGFLVGLNYAQFVGLLVGISYQGRRYWR